MADLFATRLAVRTPTIVSAEKVVPVTVTPTLAVSVPILSSVAPTPAPEPVVAPTAPPIRVYAPPAPVYRTPVISAPLLAEPIAETVLPQMFAPYASVATSATPVVASTPDATIVQMLTAPKLELAVEPPWIQQVVEPAPLIRESIVLTPTVLASTVPTPTEPTPPSVSADATITQMLLAPKLEPIVEAPVPYDQATLSLRQSLLELEPPPPLPYGERIPLDTMPSADPFLAPSVQDVLPDPCAEMACPAGTVCSGGRCISMEGLTTREALIKESLAIPSYETDHSAHDTDLPSVEVRGVQAGGVISELTSAQVPDYVSPPTTSINYAAGLPGVSPPIDTPRLTTAPLPPPPAAGGTPWLLLGAVGLGLYLLLKE